MVFMPNLSLCLSYKVAAFRAGRVPGMGCLPVKREDILVIVVSELDEYILWILRGINGRHAQRKSRDPCSMLHLKGRKMPQECF
jgi:hypothetical protein